MVTPPCLTSPVDQVTFPHIRHFLSEQLINHERVDLFDFLSIVSPFLLFVRLLFVG